MSLILQIDTASSQAGISLSKDGAGLGLLTNNAQNDHAAFLQPAVQKICIEAGIHLADIDAVSVVNGPGSYTGLRIGLASAKGICFAMNKPLVLINSLQLMAKAMILQNTALGEMLLCPMIDARRMEVFTALYDKDFTQLQAASATILSNEFLVDILLQNKICFFGNGARKFKSFTTSANAVFAEEAHTYTALCTLSQEFLSSGNVADVAYAEPFYIKAFHEG